MRPLALFALLLLAAASQAQELYRPAVGDSLQIYRHHFGKDRLPLGRGAIVQHLLPRLSSDGLVRLSILAENTATGDIVNVHFSDPFNVSRDALAPHVGPINSLSRRRTVLEYRIFGINDEGVTPAIGDIVTLYWQVVPPHEHNRLKQVLAGDMRQVLRADRQTRNSYFCESFNPGELLSVAIGKPEFTRDTKHVGVLGDLNRKSMVPMKVERFRIFSVTLEPRR